MFILEYYRVTLPLCDPLLAHEQYLDHDSDFFIQTSKNLNKQITALLEDVPGVQEVKVKDFLWVLSSVTREYREFT